MPRVTTKPRSAVITARNLVACSPASRLVCTADPWEGVRGIVAELATDHSRTELMAVAISLREHVRGAGLYDDLDEVYRLLASSSGQSIAEPVCLTRISPPSDSSYPLRRPLLVTLNTESDDFVAEIREVSEIIPLRGRGADVRLALDDLARCFARLVRENHFIPPHVRRPENLQIDAILNHLVDWQQFERENPISEGLWGKVISKLAGGRVRVRWLNGPGGITDKTTVLSGSWVHPVFQSLQKGQWFRATVKQYPDRLEWIEEPYAAPDPSDQSARQKAWEAIPTTRTDQPGAWPVESR